MTALEKIRNWIQTFPDFDRLTDFQIDYTEQTPENGGIFPSGLVEIERRKDIMGNLSVTNQYNFDLYFVFTKAAGDDAGAAVNADWVAAFQEWVQTQSVTGLAPAFGDVPNAEKIIAQNGSLYAVDGEGTATYTVQLSIQFIKNFMR